MFSVSSTDDDDEMSSVSMQPESEADWIRHQIVAFQRRLDSIDAPVAARASMPHAVASPPPPTSAQRIPSAPPAPHPGPPRREATPLSLPGIEVLLKWAGLVLLFLSAIFLVSTAIQRGWIGPELQLAGAAAIGFALIGGGFALGGRRRGWDVPLVAMGVAVLSACAAAGWAWLSLGSHEPWIFVALVVLVFAIALTARLGRPGVAGTGIATTLMALSVLADSLAELAAIAAVAIVIAEAASLWRRLSALHLVTVVAGLVTFGGIAFVSGLQNDPTSTTVLISGAVVTLVIWLMPLAFSFRPALAAASGIPWRPTIDRISASLPALFGTAWVLSTELEGPDAGLVFFVVGGLAFASAVLVTLVDRFARSVWVSQVLGAAVAITIGSIMTFGGPALLAALALQAAALLVFVEFVPDRWARIQAWLMSALAGAITFVRIIDAVDRDVPAIDDIVHIGTIGLFAAWAWWLLRRSGTNDLGRTLAGASYVGTALWAVSALIHIPQGQALISATWALLGFAALGLGFVHSSQRTTWAGFITLAVVMAKLLTVDLAAVDTFFRVALFFVLGGAFLFTSFRLGTAIRSMAAVDDD